MMRILARICDSSLRNLEGIQTISKAVLVILQRFWRSRITVQHGAICCLAEVPYKDQVIKGKKFYLIIQMRISFSVANSIW